MARRSKSVASRNNAASRSEGIERIWNAAVSSSLYADRSLLPQLTRLIDKRVEERGLQNESATVRVLRDAIRTQLRLGRTDLDRISAVAGPSPRTLQRRLANDGTSLSLLFDEVRREFAHDLLEDARLSFTDIALLLGFSEQSSFNHAFRRWFGVSPSQ